jgi:hypothetical protein
MECTDDRRDWGADAMALVLVLVLVVMYECEGCGGA